MKYPTDDGVFASVPKELKQCILGFLKDSPVFSLVCKSFNEASIERLKLLRLMQGKLFKVEIKAVGSVNVLYYLSDLFYINKTGEESDI